MIGSGRGCLVSTVVGIGATGSMVVLGLPGVTGPEAAVDGSGAAGEILTPSPSLRSEVRVRTVLVFFATEGSGSLGTSLSIFIFDEVVLVRGSVDGGGCTCTDSGVSRYCVFPRSESRLRDFDFEFVLDEPGLVFVFVVVVRVVTCGATGADGATSMICTSRGDLEDARLSSSSSSLSDEARRAGRTSTVPGCSTTLGRMILVPSGLTGSSTIMYTRESSFGPTGNAFGTLMSAADAEAMSPPARAHRKDR